MPGDGTGPQPPVVPFDAGHLAGRALDLASRAGRRLILGITGPPGAGKSTIAAAVAARLGPRAAVVPMDGFHYPGAVLRALGREQRKGAPDTFDAAGYAGLLRELRRDDGRTIRAPGFDREADEPVPGALAIPPGARVLIAEGNYLLSQDHDWVRVRAQLDAVWYVDTDPARRRERLIARHERFGKDPGRARAWADGPDEANARQIAARRAEADLTIAY